MRDRLWHMNVSLIYTSYAKLTSANAFFYCEIIFIFALNNSVTLIFQITDDFEAEYFNRSFIQDSST